MRGDGDGNWSRLAFMVGRNEELSLEGSLKGQSPIMSEILTILYILLIICDLKLFVNLNYSIPKRQEQSSIRVF